MRKAAILLTVLLLSIPCSAINDPVAHWKLDESSGSTAYDSAGSNDGTLVGNPIWTTGRIGGALEFDGSGDYVNIPDSPILDISGDQITVAAWINTNNINSRQSILSKMASGNNTWMLEVNPVDWGPGKVGFIVNTSGELPSVSTITENQWYHFVGVYNGTERMIYINGQFDASKSDTGNILTNDVPFRIGGWGSNSRYFNGKIDDVRIYDRALSEVEILELYQGFPSRFLESLEIVGPDEVVENSQTPYQAVAYYDDGGSQDVTASANWSVDPGEYAAVNGTGILTTEQLFHPQEYVTIGAEYAEGQIVTDAQIDVTITANATTTELIERNINSALAIKQNILKELETALEREKTAQEMLLGMQQNNDTGGLRRIDIIRARINVVIAIIRQIQGKQKLNESIERLERSLNNLEGNSTPAGKRGLIMRLARPSNIRQIN